MTVKQVSIKEGTTAKTFENVGKLVTHDASGTETSWYPEDSVVTEDDGYIASIVANGYYEPDESLGKFFKAVNVSVPNAGTGGGTTIIVDNGFGVFRKGGISIKKKFFEVDETEFTVQPYEGAIS